MGKTGFVRHPIYLEHVIDEYHPESPDRLVRIYNMVDMEFAEDLVAIEPREATHEEIGWVHDPAYIDQIAGTEGRRVRLDPDTGTSPQTYRAALKSTGGLLAAVDAIYAGKVDWAFTATRPPGHHAERTHSMGFCLFNNVAIAAEYAMRQYGARRVLIYDWDLHHGNGTQHAFERTDRVLYVSTHQYPYFPGTGGFGEVGFGRGEGFTINIPLSHGFGTGDFLAFIERIIKPVAAAYEPDFVIVSAGYDTYEKDPLGAMNVRTDGYGALTHRMIEIAKATAGGKLLIALEGGYHGDGLTVGVRNTLRVMLDGAAPPAWLEPEPLRPDAVEATIGRVTGIHWKYWPTLASTG